MSDPVYEQLAKRLIDLGWRPTGDAQWQNLQQAVPELRAMLFAGDVFHDASILAALPAVLAQCACRGDWEDVTVARRCIEVADAVVAARGRT